MNAPQHTDEQLEEFRRLQQEGTLPETEYEHKAWLLRTERHDVHDFPDLLNKAITLANIQSDRLMFFIEQEGRILIQWFDMAKRNPALRSVFNQLWHSFIMSLMLTRSFKGMERILQSTSQPVPEQLQGYGENIEKELKEQEKQQQEGMQFYG